DPTPYPLPTSPVNSFLNFSAENDTKKARVTWAYCDESKEAQQKLDAINRCDHNQPVIAESTHPYFVPSNCRLSTANRRLLPHRQVNLIHPLGKSGSGAVLVELPLDACVVGPVGRFGVEDAVDGEGLVVDEEGV